jgi:transcriptional regulator with PAS, ATPase and Fis domain
MPFVERSAELASYQGLRSHRQPDIVILSDPESAEDECICTRVAVVKLRYTLTSQAWQAVSSFPWRATVTASPGFPGMLSMLRTALDQLQRSDIRFAPAQDGHARGVERLRLAAPDGPRGGREIDVPLIAPGSIIEVLRLLGQLDSETYQAMCDYLRKVTPLPQDAETLLDVVLETRECLNQVSRMNGQAVIELDRRGAVIHASGPAETILRRDGPELFGQSIHEAYPALAAMITAPSAGVRQVTINGHPLDVRAAPITGQASHPGGWVLALTPRGEALGAPKPEFAKECAHGPTYHFADIIGGSPAVERVRRLALRAGRSAASVLIIGESGTGKELLAQAMHNVSPHAGGPLIAINCAAIPETLIETELFGYEGGAFTGAQRRGRPSLFERAHRGTLFLDEVGDMSPHLQATLLRVLEDGAVTRVGGGREIPVNVRIIAAANRPLEELVREGGFRRDLYHRLCVIPLWLPSLRERPQDIALLARHFLERLGDSRALPAEVLDYLERYRWPGNVRELQHCIEYMVTMADDLFTVADLPPHIQPYVQINDAQEDLNGVARRGANSVSNSIFYADSLCSSLADEGCCAILALTESANRTGIAIGRRSLQDKLRQAGFALTERAVRTRLRALHADGLVEWGLGRSGVRLTIKGRSACR